MLLPCRSYLSLRYRQRARTVRAMLASRPRLWTARLATTLVAWLIAFAVVTSLLNVFGHQLSAMSPMLRALVISGTLVVLMVNVVMPLLSVRTARWFR